MLKQVQHDEPALPTASGARQSANDRCKKL